MTKTTRKQCEFCNESFYALNREIKRGFGRKFPRSWKFTIKTQIA